MKLKFELKRGQIPYLYKLLQLAAQIWKNDERIYFYFDTDQLIIYPEQRHGFDKIFARLHVTAKDFFGSYQIKSQKEKSAILVSPHSLQSFLSDLKVLEELGYDALFKLAQCTSSDTGQVQKYLEITGFQGGQSLGVVGGRNERGETVRSFVQIDAYFDKALFPEQIEDKQVEFDVDCVTCQCILRKFRERLHVLQDDVAKVSFTRENKSAVDDDSSVRAFSLKLESDHMATQIKNRDYYAKLPTAASGGDESSFKDSYQVSLKKEIFARFFQILKLPGSATIKLNHKEMIEMNYTIEKNNHLMLLLETSARIV